MSIPLKERKNVQFVCSNMYDCYRSIAKACFPNCITLVNHYHVFADLNKRVDSVRTRIMKQARISKDKSKYYLLKNFNWMIYTNDDGKFNPDSLKKFNRHFNHYMNFYNLREKILEISHSLNSYLPCLECLIAISSIANCMVTIANSIKSFTEPSFEERGFI